MRVVVVDYDPVWPAKFAAEAEQLRGVFGAELVAIHHIGSTSVPGLRAKPIIDIMPLVRDILRVDALTGEMAGLGYGARGEYGIPGRRYFCKGGDDRSHNVHVFAASNRAEVERHLAFRDYLRSHPEEAARYGYLKAALAAQYPHDLDGYMDGKDAYVKAVQRTALAWWRTQSRTGREE